MLISIKPEGNPLAVSLLYRNRELDHPGNAMGIANTMVVFAMGIANTMVVFAIPITIWKLQIYIVRVVKEISVS